MQLVGRTSKSALKHSAGQFSNIPVQGVGAMEGPGDGAGDGIMVGEHSGGDPFGETENIGWSGRQSLAQQTGQLIPCGGGTVSHSGRFTAGSVQSRGLVASSYPRKHDSWGHPSMSSEHSDGMELGTEDGPCDGVELGSVEGSAEGAGDGIAVGEQIGGLPSGIGRNMGWSCEHSSGQQAHLRPMGCGTIAHASSSGPQSGGRELSPRGKKQVSKGQSSITSEHSDGMADGTADGDGDGTGVGSHPTLSRFSLKHSSGQHSGHSVN